MLANTFCQFASMFFSFNRLPRWTKRFTMKYQLVENWKTFGIPGYHANYSDFLFDPFKITNQIKEKRLPKQFKETLKILCYYLHSFFSKPVAKNPSFLFQMAWYSQEDFPWRRQKCPRSEVSRKSPLLQVRRRSCLVEVIFVRQGSHNQHDHSKSLNMGHLWRGPGRAPKVYHPSPLIKDDVTNFDFWIKLILLTLNFFFISS